MRTSWTLGSSNLSFYTHLFLSHSFFTRFKHAAEPFGRLGRAPRAGHRSSRGLAPYSLNDQHLWVVWRDFRLDLSGQHLRRLLFGVGYDMSFQHPPSLTDIGYCGSTTLYCGTGCQTGFGSCTPPAVASTVSTDATCGEANGGATCLNSGFGNCCSTYGWWYVYTECRLRRLTSYLQQWECRRLLWCRELPKWLRIMLQRVLVFFN